LKAAIDPDATRHSSNRNVTAVQDITTIYSHAQELDALGFVGIPMFNNDDLEKQPTKHDEKMKQFVQPSGYLMVLNVDTLRINQASANFSKLVAGGAKTIIGLLFEDLFGMPIAANLRRRVNKEGRTLMLITGDFPLFGQRKFNCLVHTDNSKIIVEMEESLDSSEPTAEQTATLTDAVAAFGKAEDLTNLIRLIPREIKKLTGFDRIMVYKLDQIMTGQIVAEEVSSGMDSYLNFLFPAEDISFETCDGYCRNTVRAIADTSYQPSEIIGNGNSIDLSNCSLASVSAKHLEYLKEHDIAASISISIVCNDRLWGLIVCHNRTAKGVPHWLRSYCEVVGKLISLRVSAYEDGAERDLKDKLRRLFDGMRDNPSRDTLEHLLMSNASTILELFDGQGMAMVSHDQIKTYPVAPKHVDISKYAEWLKATHQKNVFIEDNLRSKFPLEGMIDAASGVITLSFQAHDFSLHIFRPELTQTFTWASSIFMNVDKRRNTEKSLEKLRQTIEKHSEPWTLNQMFMAQVFFDSIKSVLATIDKKSSDTKVKD
jgi:light-regulated signal transduction histidine kinase (bacteriophytochrome)